MRKEKIYICQLCFVEFKSRWTKKFCSNKCLRIHQSLHPNGGAFKKGHKSWNKGVKGTHFSPETEFKKGRRIEELAPVFSVRRRKRKRDKYSTNFIKVAMPNTWISFSRFVWGKYYGKLFEGDVVFHINGRPYDDWIGNLVAIPRRWEFGLNHKILKLTQEKIEYFRNRYMEFYSKEARNAV